MATPDTTAAITTGLNVLVQAIEEMNEEMSSGNSKNRHGINNNNDKSCKLSLKKQ